MHSKPSPQIRITDVQLVSDFFHRKTDELNARVAVGVLLGTRDCSCQSLLSMKAEACCDDDVSILHGVTLGGTGKAAGDRHPKIRKNVILGANATLLGNITIGASAKVGAGSVVLNDVPEGVTVAGVPAVIVGGS